MVLREARPVGAVVPVELDDLQTSRPVPISHARRGSGPRKAIPGKRRAFAASSANSSTTTPRERPVLRISCRTRASASRLSRTEKGCVFEAIASRTYGH
jgi:hypothetical protein